MKNTVMLAIAFLSLLQPIEAQNNPVKITREYKEETKSYKIYAENTAFSTKTIFFEFTNTQNLSCTDGPRGFRKSLRGRSKALLTTVKPRDPNSGVSFGYTYKTYTGCRRSKPAYDHPYLIPLGNGKTTIFSKLTYINKEYGNEEEPDNWYSAMFTAAEGDTIFAARKGLVTLMKENENQRDGDGLLFERTTNFITVEHEDCTYADYKMFKTNQIFVDAGEQIIPGQPLGIVGGENYSSGPHVRFQVRYFVPDNIDENGKNAWAYVPPRFVTPEGTRELTAKTTYNATSGLDIIMLEMTKRERKRFKKRKSN